MEKKSSEIHAVDCLIMHARLAPVSFDRHVLCTQSAELLNVRMAEHKSMKEEVQRLRALCEAHDIDPSDLGASEDTLRAVPSEPQGG